MNKLRERKERRLTELLGVLLLLVEHSEDETEREFFTRVANKIENKLKELKI